VYPNADTPELEEVFNASNCCYEPFICSPTRGILSKRMNATSWESLVSGCRKYYCDNATGRASWNKCNTTPDKGMICLSQSCVSNTSVATQGWTVVVTFTSLEESDFDETAFLEEVSKVTGVSQSQMTFASEIDAEGFIESAYLIVNTEETANSMAEKLRKAFEETPCNYDMLCEGEKVIIIPKVVTVVSSGYRNFGSLLLLFFVVIISSLF